jgi:hypothetical protein
LKSQENKYKYYFLEMEMNMNHSEHMRKLMTLVESALTQSTILLEYDAEKTWVSYGPKLIQAAKKDWSIDTNIKKGDPEQLKQFVLQSIQNSDPTPHQEYSQWLAKVYANGGVSLEDLMSTGRDTLTKFAKLKLKKKLQPEDKDIGRFRSINDLANVLEKYNDIDLSSGKDKDKQKADMARDNAELFYDDDTVRIIKPNDVTAAMYYGRGTKWCTAAENNNMYKHYAQSGDLYIVIPKHPSYTGEKYQFHFQAKQFMNEKDQPISIATMLDLYPSVREALNSVSDGNRHFSLDPEERTTAMRRVVYDELRSNPEGKDYNGLLVINMTGLAKNHDYDPTSAESRFGHNEEEKENSREYYAETISEVIKVGGDDIGDIDGLLFVDSSTGGIFYVSRTWQGDGVKIGNFISDISADAALELVAPERRELVSSMLGALLSTDPMSDAWSKITTELGGAGYDYLNDDRENRYDDEYDEEDEESDY